MKVVQTVGHVNIVFFAGCYKLRDDKGNDVGGIYPSKGDAYDAAIEWNREYLGITVKGKEART